MTDCFNKVSGIWAVTKKRALRQVQKMKKSSTAGEPKSTSGFNYQMCLLSVIGICFIVIGHINFGNSNYDLTPMGTFHGWFPYYSFHLPVFLFITGYFFRDFSRETEHSFGKYLGRLILKKARTLLLPYYIVNGIFLLGGTLLTRAGVTYLAPFTLQRWLLFPWTKNYIITYSLPTWYLIALFLAEIYYVLLRKLVQLSMSSSLAQELVLLLLTLVLGVAAVYFKNTGHPSETATVYLRSVVMLFFIQCGVLYRKFLEKKDTLPSGWYFLIVFVLQFLIILLTGNNDLSPGLYALTGFDTFGINYFLAGITGLALWLRITRLLASIPPQSSQPPQSRKSLQSGQPPQSCKSLQSGKSSQSGKPLPFSRLLRFIGTNTKYIMCFHVFGFFVVNALFSFLYSHKICMTLLSGFSIRTWKSYLYYAHTDNPRMVLLYFLGAMGVSLLLALGIDRVKKLGKKIKNILRR